MAETYRVIDLSNLYARFCQNIAFLVLTDDENKAETVKRIRIEPKRFCDMKYREDEDIRIILKNSSTGKYDVLEVPFQKGIYGMYNIITEKRPNDDYFYSYDETWKKWGKIHEKFEENLTILDNLIVIERDQSFHRRFVITDAMEIGETKMFLRQVSHSALPKNIEKELFDKCVQGGRIFPSDFFQVIDVDLPSFRVFIEFGNLKFEINGEEVLVSKQLTRVGNRQEEITCRFSKRRIGIPSMFFSYVIKAELENQLLQRIEGKFVY